MPLQIVDVYSQGQTIIKGAGATFPDPLIDTWRLEFEKLNPNLNVDYQAIGSGGGVQKLIDKAIDFGAVMLP